MNIPWHIFASISGRLSNEVVFWGELRARWLFHDAVGDDFDVLWFTYMIEGAVVDEESMDGSSMSYSSFWGV